MSTDTTAARPAPAARARFSEQVHVLVDADTRAYTLGLAALAAIEGGYTRLKEGEAVRDLISAAMIKHYEDDPKGYGSVILAGRAEIAKRTPSPETSTA